MRGDDVVHAVRKNFFGLQFRLEHRLGEDGVRMIEHAAKKRVDEPRVDAPAEPARENFFAAVLEVLALVEKAVGDEKFRVAFLGGQAAPDFRHDQTHVVIHRAFGPT